MSVDVLSTRERLVARRRAEQGLPPKPFVVVAPEPPQRAKRPSRAKPMRDAGPVVALPVRVRTVVCRECGATFNTQSAGQRMCSDPCRVAAHKAREARRRIGRHPATHGNCATCGKPFTSQWATARYCSRACHTKFNSQIRTARRKQQEAPSGNTSNQ